MENYSKLSEIGKGAYGTTYLVHSKVKDQFYCLKEISFTGMGDEDKEKSMKEVHILKTLNSGYVVGFIEYWANRKTLSMVMEYCGGGDLEGVIKKATVDKTLLPENVILSFLMDITYGMMHVHQQKILHRDIKPSNVFLTESGIAKIGDFGISRVLLRTSSLGQTTVGTPYYLSPEVISGKPYDHKSDVWSIGCVLYELCTSKHLFDGNNLMALVFKIMNNDIPNIPDVYSNELKVLRKIRLFFSKENAVQIS